MHEATEQTAPSAGRFFGLRKVSPRACIADKPHLQTFFCEALEDLGFVTCKYDPRWDLGELLAGYQPDLFVVGPSVGGIDAARLLESLSAHHFRAKILVVGAPAAPLSKAVHGCGVELGLNMLPLLATPFSHEALRDSLSELLPRETPPNPVVDLAEALHANWLELWYQPKVEIRSLTLCGAEALIRMRHPTWGIVQPASFIPDAHDPQLLALADFVLSRAMRDWRSFSQEYGHVALAVNLPGSVIEHPEFTTRLTQHLPSHSAFAGAIVEVNATDMIRSKAAVLRAAGRLRFYNIALSVDDVGTEWPALLELADLPFAEIKVDRNIVCGCADNRLKQVVCRRILEFARSAGMRTVAQGVENRADFAAVRGLGFDIVQGSFLAKPMDARKFARRMLRQPLSLS